MAQMSVVVRMIGWMWAWGFAVTCGVLAGVSHAQCGPVKLLSDDIEGGDNFGRAVVIEGDTMVVGAPRDETQSGAVYVFTRADGVWNQQAKLLPDDGEPGDEFGYSVSLSGDTIVAGAWKSDANGSLSGSAYVFVRSGDSWTLQAVLLPSDARAWHYFGFSVAVDGDTALIGALHDRDNGLYSGAAYVFERSGGVWTQQAKLLPSDGSEGDHFGYSVVVTGSTAVVGARDDDDNGTSSGSVYIFTPSSGEWAQRAKLVAADGSTGDAFGRAVALDQETGTLVIGASLDNDGGITSAGSVYVYEGSEGEWTQQAKLLASDRWLDERFGSAVAIDGDRMVIGARQDDDNGRQTGSAYLFTRSDGVWTEWAKFLPDEALPRDDFGISASVSGDTAVVGALYTGDYESRTGAAFVIDLGCKGCRADFNGDGEVNDEDFFIFRYTWLAGEAAADWNRDGTVDTLDFLAFLDDWAASC